MARLLRELERSGRSFRGRRALDLFAGCGKLQTIDYASEVGSLEVWEIDARHQARLKRDMPHARIKIVDTIQEIRRTPDRFGVLVVDNPSVFGANKEYVEHFDLFPDLMRIAESPALIILNVIPKVDTPDPLRPASVFTKEHLAGRRRFYRTDRPKNVSYHQMISVYRDLVEQGGFQIDWHCLVGKWRFYKYLVLEISRRPAPFAAGLESASAFEPSNLSAPAAAAAENSRPAWLRSALTQIMACVAWLSKFWPE
jgi:hypothetical protein